ncbi:MAG: DUF3781 domain-containing protein [Carnobacterium sp.]|uniref:DUF3781 domain-containing protein n=1 Tax=Carnobacterium sp. TaxID=48221 RepID=UPI002FC7CF8B
MEKNTIIEKVCYTDLVFERVNKKFSKTMTQNEIKFLVLAILNDNRSQFEKIGKNYYVSNMPKGIKLVINSSTYRLITVDKI